MTITRRYFVRLAFLAVLILLPAHHALAADSLNWNKQQNRVDADIRDWDVIQVLEIVAQSTGWEVYFDPGAEHKVSARFRNLPPGDALKALLGNINFVILPGANGKSDLYVFRTSQGQATRQVRPAAKAAQPIPNQLIVTLKPGSKTKIDDLARSLGAKVIGRIDGQNAYLLQFDDAASTQSARTQLANNPDVDSVDYNYPVDRPPSISAAGGASAPDLQLNPQTNNGPCKLVIGLIDTRVQSLGPKLDAFIKPGNTVVAGADPSPDQLTHGTAMATTILDAVANKTKGGTSVVLLPQDVFGANESSSTFAIAQGMTDAVNGGATIINASLGGTGDSGVLRRTVSNIVQRGIPIYAAAGNEPVTTPTYPAAYPGVIAVTASDRSGQIASYANRGDFVSLMAPGDNIVGFDGRSYLVQGTSTSTAFASGMAAGLADTAHVCADEANALLQKNLAAPSASKR